MGQNESTTKYETREHAGTVEVKGGVIVIMDPTVSKTRAITTAHDDAKRSEDGYAVSEGIVAFQAAWRDGSYDVFVYKDEDNKIVNVEMKLKED